MKITLTIDDMVFELDAASGADAKAQVDGIRRAFTCKAPKDDTRPDATPLEMLVWVDEFPGNHSIRWLDRNCPFGNAKTMITRLEKEERLVLAETLYQGKKHMQTMQAVYLPGTEPSSLPEAGSGALRARLGVWLKDNPGHAVKFVEDHCGIIRSRAKATLTKLITADTVEVREVKGKPCVFLKGTK